MSLRVEACRSHLGVPRRRRHDLPRSGSAERLRSTAGDDGCRWRYERRPKQNEARRRGAVAERACRRGRSHRRPAMRPRRRTTHASLAREPSSWGSASTMSGRLPAACTSTNGTRPHFFGTTTRAPMARASSTSSRRAFGLGDSFYSMSPKRRCRRRDSSRCCASSSVLPTTARSSSSHWYEPPDSAHPISANASTTEPARLLAVIVADDGVEITIVDH